MSNDTLLSSLVDSMSEAFIFLETSGDDAVNPDDAVRCMENMSAPLISMDVDDQRRVRALIHSRADDSENSLYSDFMRSLPDMIGLVE